MVKRTKPAPFLNDPLWYKDAVIYQVHVKSFYDSNNDGIGDFKGLIEKLDYLKDLGVTTVTMRDTGSTDHIAYDAVGLPGFQFIQDGIDYGTRTHHSNMDTFERVIPNDVMQASVVMATFAYHAAMRDEKLPRKPKPEPREQEND